ncbi:MAG TPA: hypothetical protein ENJ42_06250 [Hellea balneolensis]|uniref:Uncharacterized protein n=1 Tax=Hellea balneolensis TaxID=287478 RepID=A0A7C5QS42_9PROT|nr:hypothetical protein [Hellea balneolensis]
MLNFLSRTPVLIGSFIGMVLIGNSLGMVGPKIGGRMLDLIMNTPDALARLAAMSDAQKRTHMLATLSLDSLFPLFNFAFLAGIAARLAGAWRRWAILPALIYMVFDFAENSLEVFALNGAENIMPVKTVLTLIKFTSFSLASVLALGLIVWALARWARRKWQKP